MRNLFQRHTRTSFSGRISVGGVPDEVKLTIKEDDMKFANLNFPTSSFLVARLPATVLLCTTRYLHKDSDRVVIIDVVSHKSKGL